LPIAIEGGRIPFLLKKWATTNSAEVSKLDSSPLRIALVNNMPDAALEDTEVQFTELLGAAAGGAKVVAAGCLAGTGARVRPGRRPGSR